MAKVELKLGAEVTVKEVAYKVVAIKETAVKLQNIETGEEKTLKKENSLFDKLFIEPEAEVENPETVDMSEFVAEETEDAEPENDEAPAEVEKPAPKKEVKKSEPKKDKKAKEPEPEETEEDEVEYLNTTDEEESSDLASAINNLDATDPNEVIYKLWAYSKTDFEGLVKAWLMAQYYKNHSKIEYSIMCDIVFNQNTVSDAETLNDIDFEELNETIIAFSKKKSLKDADYLEFAKKFVPKNGIDKKTFLQLFVDEQFIAYAYNLKKIKNDFIKALFKEVYLIELGDL